MIMVNFIILKIHFIEMKSDYISNNNMVINVFAEE